SGTVADNNPVNVVITFGGAVAQTTNADASGHFSLITTEASLGEVTAQGSNGQGELSNLASATIACPPPALTAQVTTGNNKMVTVAGAVTDDLGAGGLTVQITGVAAGSVVTKADGTFSWIGQASELGAIKIWVTNSWGLGSNPVENWVTA